MPLTSEYGFTGQIRGIMLYSPKIKRFVIDIIPIPCENIEVLISE